MLEIATSSESIWFSVHFLAWSKTGVLQEKEICNYQTVLLG